MQCPSTTRAALRPFPWQTFRPSPPTDWLLPLCLRVLLLRRRLGWHRGVIDSRATKYSGDSGELCQLVEPEVVDGRGYLPFVRLAKLRCSASAFRCTREAIIANNHHGEDG
jgi:hypothetical protein